MYRKKKICRVVLDDETEAGDGLQRGWEMVSMIRFPPHLPSAAVSGVSVTVSGLILLCFVLFFFFQWVTCKEYTNHKHQQRFWPHYFWTKHH